MSCLLGGFKLDLGEPRTNGEISLLLASHANNAFLSSIDQDILSETISASLLLDTVASRDASQ